MKLGHAHFIYVLVSVKFPDAEQKHAQGYPRTLWFLKLFPKQLLLIPENSGVLHNLVCNPP